MNSYLTMLILESNSEKRMKWREKYFKLKIREKWRELKHAF